MARPAARARTQISLAGNRQQVPTFTYRAVDVGGDRTKGVITAPSEAAVVEVLASRGLLVLEVDQAEEAAPARFGRRRHVLEFTRAVAALLPAGMPLARALGAAATVSPAPMRPVIEAVRARVERGDELAEALAEHPHYFSPLYIGIVRAGERNGSLNSAFQRLSDHLERQQELSGKLVSMAIYPALLAASGFGAVLVLVLFVLPRFAELLQGAGAALPAATAMVIAASTWLRESWQLLAAGGALLVVVGMWMRLSSAGREAATRLLVRAPLIGQWRRMALGAEFARMVGELLAGGTPLLSALGDARDCMANEVMRAEVEAVRARVREGGALNEAIAGRGIFPPVLTQLVALGEDSGRVSDFLLKAADLLERRLTQTLERAVAMAEPAMIVIFGGIVALVALALLQAIYGVNAGSF